jgi:hypothetical protein
MLTRYNPIGLSYTIYADNDPNKTVISLSGKRIIVDCSLEDVSQRWYLLADERATSFNMPLIILNR